MTGTVLIRPVGENEREAWNPLWEGYLAFYKSALTQDISDLAWQRFHDPDEPMFALGGYVDGWPEFPITCSTARPGRPSDTATWRICSSRTVRVAGDWAAR